MQSVAVQSCSHRHEVGRFSAAVSCATMTSFTISSTLVFKPANKPPQSSDARRQLLCTLNFGTIELVSWVRESRELQARVSRVYHVVAEAARRHGRARFTRRSGVRMPQ